MGTYLRVDPVWATFFAAQMLLTLLILFIVEIARPDEIDAIGGRMLVIVVLTQTMLFVFTFIVGAIRGGPHFYAVRCGDIGSLHRAISEKYRLTDKTLFGETLLHIATRYMRKEIAMFLLEAGLSPEIADRFGRTSRSIAEAKSDRQMLSLFETFDDRKR